MAGETCNGKEFVRQYEAVQREWEDIQFALQYVDEPVNPGP